MKIQIIFTFYLVMGGGTSMEVIGYLRGKVLIKCKYKTELKTNVKYFYSGTFPTRFDHIRTAAKNRWVNEGRFSLYDDTSTSEFCVMIRELTVEDSGTYQCGVDIEKWLDNLIPVELKVKKEQCCEKSISKTGYVGRDVNIICNYPSSLSSHPKFLCRREGDADCHYKTAVSKSRTWINMGKMCLYENRAKKIFNVTLYNLTEQDSGEYWCGAESDWTSDHGYKIYITQINLRVIITKPLQKVSSTTSSSLSSTSSLPSSFVTSPPLNLTTVLSSATGFPASSVIIVVCGILVLILIGICIVTRINRKNIKGITSTSKTFLPDSGIKDDIPFTVNNAAAISGATSTSSLPTIPFNICNAETKLSIGSYDPTMVYASTQITNTTLNITGLPTAQQTDEKSDEVSNYATLTFSTLADSSNRKKVEISCDYATVNYAT